MECLFGFVGKDFVVTVSDNSAARSITVMKTDEVKSRELNKHTLMLYSGEPGDTVQFAEFIQCNVQLYGIRNGVELSPVSAARYTRRELANSLRSKHPYQVNLLIGGCNEKEGPSLHWIDYLGAYTSVPFASHGYGAFYLMSLFDRFHRPDINTEEAKVLVQKCIEELKRRFIVNLPNFSIKIIDREGIRDLDVVY
ncbi:Proteasome subunit beta type-4 [Basidiobolus ranarum]|uniref:Proteasome subunit beta n=1 Tax=Basidiobolus ranarum TaxID=34480 RepID=A0ABR2WU18_9FUNG